LLTCLGNFNTAIENKLGALINDLDFQSLTDEEAEENVLRYSTLYSYLYVAASFVERSDIPHTIVELVQPIKRLMQQQCQLGDFELLLHPLPILNYSFFPLGALLSDVTTQLSISDASITFPEQLVTIGFPGLETERILVHSLIAHELGHCLYIKHGLEQKLLTRVKPIEKELDSLVKEWAATKVGSTEAKETPTGQHTLSDYISQVEIRSLVTRQINSISKAWVKELTCDAIGYCLSGPAYLFASLDFLTLINPFDNDLGKHPPNRMRFLLLYKMLDEEKDFLEILDPKVKEFLDSWKNVTRKKSVKFSSPISRLAGNAILNIYQHIIDEATSAVGYNGLYSASKNTTELQKLVKRINDHVPPNEILVNGVFNEAKFQSILNSGWLVYLTGLGELQRELKVELWESKVKFNELIARAIELNEVQRRWKEVQ